MDTKFFFIDDQGGNNNQEWILLGGILISGFEYKQLSEQIRSIREDFAGIGKEIKYSELQRGIKLKKDGKPLKKTLAYLSNKTTKEIEDYIEVFFQWLNMYSFKIIISVVHERFIYNKNKLLEHQIENLMERAQMEGQSSNSLVVMVHDNTSCKKTNVALKNIYQSKLSNSAFIQKYTRILDNLFIEESHVNIGIQVSDFVIGVIAGTLRSYPLSTQIFNKYVKNNLRKDNTGKIVGYGIVLFPNNNLEFKNMIERKLELNILERN